jgi:DNA-binding FadR family transcriptional regulator
MNVTWIKPIMRTLSDQVTDAILHRIASGEIQSGQSLPPHRELAIELGVGLSVVREAIQRLQVLNVVKTRHGSGTIVEELSWAQIAMQPALHVLAMQPHLQDQISEARYAIEKETTLLAAARATEEDIAAMTAIIELATPPPAGFTENIQLNSQFHLAIAQASMNTVLKDMLKPLLEIGFSTVPEVFDSRSANRAWQSHRLLLSAIAAHDRAAALKALEFHRSTGVAEIEKTKSFWSRTKRASARRSGRGRAAAFVSSSQ